MPPFSPFCSSLSSGGRRAVCLVRRVPALTPVSDTPPCLGQTHLLFPDGMKHRGSQYTAKQAEGRDALCPRCPSPLREACIRVWFAHRWEDNGGVWGGTTEAERTAQPPALCRSCNLPVDPLTARYHTRCHECRSMR